MRTKRANVAICLALALWSAGGFSNVNRGGNRPLGEGPGTVSRHRKVITVEPLEGARQVIARQAAAGV